MFNRRSRYGVIGDSGRGFSRSLRGVAEAGVAEQQQGGNAALVTGIFDSINQITGTIISGVRDIKAAGRAPEVTPEDLLSVGVGGISATTPWGRIAIGGVVLAVGVGTIAYLVTRKR